PGSTALDRSILLDLLLRLWLLLMLSRRRLSRYASVSYASAALCGPMETDLPRVVGWRMLSTMRGKSEALGKSVSSREPGGTDLYSLAGVKYRRGRFQPTCSRPRNR